MVLRNGSAISPDDIIEFCRKRLAGFKCPKKIFIAKALEKNPSGKILKRELREKYAA